MRTVITAFAGLVLSFSLCLFYVSNAHANVYAAQLKVSNPDDSEFDGNFSDGTGAKLSFFLNDTASVVTVEVVDLSSGTVVSTIDGGSMSRGLNSVEWDGSGSEAGASYVFRVTAEQPNASNDSWTMFWDSGDIDIFTRGVDVVKDQSDPQFGIIHTSNDGGPLGTGINVYNPDGSFHDPFLVAADLTSGGAIDYAGTAPLHVTSDYMGRLYVSNGDLGQVMRIDRDYSASVIIDGLTSPKGLYVEGEGDNLTVYVAATNQVLRGTIGTATSFPGASMEVVADFTTFFPRQVILDDDGALYVTQRAGTTLGADGNGIQKYDISGSLPVTDNDANLQWTLAKDRTFIANDLFVDRGSDPTAVDDILYYCTRAEGGNDQDGIWRVTDLNSVFPDTVRIITEDDLYVIKDNNISFNATFDFDAAGNIVFMENANEHIFFISPPGQGDTNSYTTTGNDTMTVEVDVNVETTGEIVPTGYSLAANYPNPFNPSTTINYVLGGTGETTLKVYNLLGGEIRMLVNEVQAAGEYSVTWDGKENTGSNVASGVYILHLKSGDFSQSRRITLMK